MSADQAGDFGFCDQSCKKPPNSRGMCYVNVGLPEIMHPTLRLGDGLLMRLSKVPHCITSGGH